ncbi:hypothetical protein POSPLADRAFT_1046788 [Postia placenta MAD-698-R-SB12]|uniref:NadR/Ttd14 AAA domain-containing protein n=1 Tax=Postia placenta MAD-698-R-SB12 TaxID=670580 RepID=A0A1X6MYE0_9APHY|nr:hypothetical protein POSPLADRAFT_1046788 [Postia placenta MAD-698-R-SB12]OSX61367.1 hypothetical protein POSPLADRAFT_1046788 [Postia placenta MAD-698-R-SB12]
MEKELDSGPYDCQGKVGQITDNGITVDGHVQYAYDRLVRAVFILGPSSSGKTTLCNALVEDLGLDRSRYVTEVARNVMKTHGFTRHDTDTFEMQHTIMMAQLRAEEAVLKRYSENIDFPLDILSDRSAIDPAVYAGTSTAAGAAERQKRLLNDPAFRAVLPLYQKSTFVQDWFEDDGVRSLEDPRVYNTHLFAVMEELGIPFVCIGEERKDIRDRVDFVRELLEQQRA